MIFKNIKIAHEHFNFPGSYRHGTIITNNLAIRIYSNMDSAPDYFNKSKSIFYYTIKTNRRFEAFKQNKKEDYSPDKPEVLRRRRFRNRLVFLLYIDVIVIFFLLNILAAQILEKIMN